MTRLTASKKTIKSKFVVNNDRGLHTRPCTELVRCASSFRARVTLTYQKQIVNAKSLLSILGLAACKGAKIGIIAEGEDAQDAVEALIGLALNNFYINY